MLCPPLPSRPQGAVRQCGQVFENGSLSEEELGSAARIDPAEPEKGLFQPGEPQCRNQAKRKSKRERTNFGSKLAGPKIGKLNFGGWRNRSCAIETNPRQPAPLIRYKPIERPITDPRSNTSGSYFLTMFPPRPCGRLLPPRISVDNWSSVAAPLFGKVGQHGFTGFLGFGKRLKR